MEGAGNENHGIRAENEIEKALKESLLADFVFHDTEFKIGGKTRESADLFLMHKDTLIVIQSKSRQIPEGGDPTGPVELERIRSKAEEATIQIKTILRAIKGGDRLNVVNLRGIPVPFSKTTIATKKIIGIATIEVINRSGSSVADRISIYGGLGNSGGILVHILLKKDLLLLLSWLDTIPDFLNYLDARARLKREKKIAPSTEERDLLALFLFNYPQIKKCLCGEVDLLATDGDLLRGYLREISDHAQHLEDRWAKSQIFDKTIEDVFRCIGCTFYGSHDSASGHNRADIKCTPEIYKDIADELACFPRALRMIISEAMIDAAKKADSVSRGFSYKLAGTTNMGGDGHDTAGLLYLSYRPDINKNDNNTYREKRANLLADLSVAAMFKLNLTKLIGIATENYSSIDRSHDYILVKGPLSGNLGRIKTIAEKAFGEKRFISTDLFDFDHTGF